MILSPEQLRTLQFEALTDKRTIERMYSGEPGGRAMARERVERAARKLGFPLPPRAKGAK